MVLIVTDLKDQENPIEIEPKKKPVAKKNNSRLDKLPQKESDPPLIGEQYDNPGENFETPKLVTTSEILEVETTPAPITLVDEKALEIENLKKMLRDQELLNITREAEERATAKLMKKHAAEKEAKKQAKKLKKKLESDRADRDESPPPSKRPRLDSTPEWV